MSTSTLVLHKEQIVKTPFGQGVISEIREQDVAVTPTSWKLASGQEPIFYINPSDLNPLFKIGDKCRTLFGSGKIVGIRKSDAIYEVRLMEWRLANERSPTVYLNYASLREYQQRKSILKVKKVKIKEEKKYEDQMPVGTRVKTPYGIGSIVSHRLVDKSLVIEPENWNMANGKPPKFYLQREVVSAAPLPTPPSKSETEYLEQMAEERLQRALRLKDEGTKFFKEKDIETALARYTFALQTIQGLGESSNNERRAMIFELTIPCSNNLAICLIKLKRYAEAIIYARNSHDLIEALEGRFDGKVWGCLQARGMTRDGLTKFKRKSLYLLGKSELLREEYEDAKTHLKESLSLFKPEELTSNEASEIKDLIHTATTKFSKQKEKQKAVWSKAFQKNSEDGKKEEEETSEIKNKIAAKIPSLLPTSLLSSLSPKKANGVTTEKESKEKKSVSVSVPFPFAYVSSFWNRDFGSNAGKFIGIGSMIGIVGLATYFSISIMTKRKK